MKSSFYVEILGYFIKSDVASVAVMDGSKILMGKRRDSGRWTLPGGHADPGEKKHDAAKRELKEEAGIDVDKDDLNHLGSNKVTTFTGKKKTIHAFHVKHNGSKPTSENDPDKEVEKWVWVETKAGLPKRVKENLHSPKNLVLQKLGLLKSNQRAEVVDFYLNGELFKGGSHKYIRKYMQDGEWVYVYKEPTGRAKKMTPEAVSSLHKLAELGNEHAKGLVDNIEEVHPDRLAVLYREASNGDRESIDHLKEHYDIDHPGRPAPKLVISTPQVSSPRTEAAEVTQEMASSEYANDRSSSIEQRGEDVLGSARHSALAWTTMRDALASGDAEQLFARDFLLSQDPVDFKSEMNSDNMDLNLLLNFALRKFPDPKIPASSEENTNRQRQSYYEAFQAVKEIIKSNANKTVPSTEHNDLMFPHEKGLALYKKSVEQVHALYGRTRTGRGYDAGTEAIREFYNLMVGRGSKSPKGALGEFHTKGASATKEELVGAAKKVIDGKSINAAFNKVERRDAGFDVSAQYDTAVMKREGPSSRYTGSRQGLDILDKSAGGDMKMRGVQWGKSVTDAERSHHLKSVVDSFDDLTDILGLPKAMASFNGRLALAIGARGKGGALAHYEPGKQIINLTRASGAGSLAHEWGHFFDHTISNLSEGRTDNFDANFATTRATRVVGNNPVMAAMKKMYESPEFRAMNDRIRTSVRRLRLDTSYWNSNLELFARTFERHIQHKLEKAGRENTYLTAVRKRGEDKDNLWPMDSEIEKLSPMMDEIFKQFRESDMLTKALYYLSMDLFKGLKGQSVAGHKYLRKYMYGGQWVYVYHEGDQHGRQIPEEAFNHIKKLAESGNEHAKALHDSLQAHDEKKMKLLRELADTGNSDAHEHLKKLGINRKQEKLEEKLIPRVVRTSDDPIHELVSGDAKSHIINLIGSQLHESIFEHLQRHSGNVLHVSLVNGGITKDSIKAALSHENSLYDILAELHKQMDKIDTAHTGMRSVNESANDAGGYGNLGYNRVVKHLEEKGILPQGYSEIHTRTASSGSSVFEAPPVRGLAERQERARREEAEASRREVGEYAPKVDELAEYYGKTFTSKEKKDLAKGIKKIFGPAFSMKKFDGYLNPDPANKTVIRVSDGFLTGLMSGDSRFGFGFAIKDRVTGDHITGCTRDISVDSDRSITWHNGVFRRPSNELLTKYSGMSKGLYAGVETFLKEVTADLPKSAKDKCNIYMSAANGGFSDGYKGAVLWAKHYFDFNGSSNLNTFKSTYTARLPDAKAKLPDLAAEIDAAMAKIADKKHPFEFIKLGIPLTQAQAEKVVGHKMDFDYKSMFAKPGATIDLGEILLVKSGMWFDGISYFNKTAGTHQMLNEKRAAYYQKRPGVASPAGFKSSRVDATVRDKWKPKGRSIVMTDARLREIGSWSKDEVAEFHAKAPLTTDAKRRVKEILDRIGG